jgi:biotin transporter BioY
MRRYGLYDATRGLTLALAAALAGLLLYLATQVGQQTTARFWAEMGIVAGAGLVLALAPVLGGWSSGLRLRLSPGTFLLGFIPVLVVVGWILMATQPGNGWHEGTVVRWSHDMGLMGLIHDVALWHGVLAFGFGLVLGTTMDAVPVAMVEPVAAAGPTRSMPVEERETEPTSRTRRPWYRRRSQFTTDADAPTTAEERAQQRAAARRAEPPMVPVGRNTDDVEE